MVVNLCLPHFNTSISSNKLCADGYDVANLVSADPALRRRGFKLEYFLRPPVQVTLKFGFQVELWRVDVELWPWGMDRGQCCKRLEISTSADPPSAKSETRQAPTRDRERLHVRADKSYRWGEFKLVGRCELRDETRVSFARSLPPSGPPFCSPLPPQPLSCLQEELWSRDPPSVGSVSQLRLTLPFGGAASALGFKALAVWGQPARGCPPEEVERIRKLHEASLRPAPAPDPPVRQRKRPLQETAPPSESSNILVPEEFLDPITQEIMKLPMLLPSGVSVDHDTLEEYQKREATWGRAQNDPFTGVPFTPTSRPLPNPQLKSRIDHFLLRNAAAQRDGTLGRERRGGHPQPSRLVASETEAKSGNSAGSSGAGDEPTRIGGAGSGAHGDLAVDGKPISDGVGTPQRDGTEEQLPPAAKKPRNDPTSGTSCSSHEQRLSTSLDEALCSVLRGRPSFTSNLSTRDSPAVSEPRGSSQQPTGEKTCTACSSPISVYSTPASAAYRLACGHLLCRRCLQEESQRLCPVADGDSDQVRCARCGSSTPRRDITRVHH